MSPIVIHHTTPVVQPHPANQNEAEYWLHRFRALQATSTQLYTQLQHAEAQAAHTFFELVAVQKKLLATEQRLAWLSLPTLIYTAINRLAALLWATWHRLTRKPRKGIA